MHRSDRLSGLLFFEGDQHRRVCRQADRLAFGISEQAQICKVMVAFVVSLAAIGLRELDPAGLNAIDGSDMNAIGSNNFHASRLGDERR